MCRVRDADDENRDGKDLERNTADISTRRFQNNSPGNEVVDFLESRVAGHAEGIPQHDSDTLGQEYRQSSDLKTQPPVQPRSCRTAGSITADRIAINHGEVTVPHPHRVSCDSSVRRSGSKGAIKQIIARPVSVSVTSRMSSSRSFTLTPAHYAANSLIKCL
ncbi:uncharacterized [Tachysurus ichikawai]